MNNITSPQIVYLNNIDLFYRILIFTQTPLPYTARVKYYFIKHKFDVCTACVKQKKKSACKDVSWRNFIRNIGKLTKK